MLAVGMRTSSEMQATRAIARYGIASSFGLKAGKLSVPVRRVHHAVQRPIGSAPDWRLANLGE
jgi:hypothetical protein